MSAEGTRVAGVVLPSRRDFAMTTAREIMHAGAECIGEHQTMRQAAQRMRALDIGALPICATTIACTA